MKRLGLFMTVIMILCITVNAQKQSNRTLVAYFSATGTTEKAAKQVAEVTGGGDRRSPLRNTTCKEIYLRRPGLAQQILAQQCGNGRRPVTSRIAFPAQKLGNL